MKLKVEEMTKGEKREYPQYQYKVVSSDRIAFFFTKSEAEDYISRRG